MGPKESSSLPAACARRKDAEDNVRVCTAAHVPSRLNALRQGVEPPWGLSSGARYNSYSDVERWLDRMSSRKSGPSLANMENVMVDIPFA